MSLFIRKAEPADLPMLLQFEQGIIEAEKPFDPTLKRTDSKYYNLDEMLQSPLVHLLVAQLENKLVGCGYARTETAKLYLQHRQYGYLGFMFVLPEHRGKGVNKMILERLEEWLLEKGIEELRLEVYCKNLPAIKAYEKAGFKPHMIEMRKGRL